MCERDKYINSRRKKISHLPDFVTFSQAMRKDGEFRLCIDDNYEKYFC